MNSKIKNNLLGKIIILIWITMLIFSACGLVVEASPTEVVNPESNQYIELKATKIKDVNNKRQVIMELWGYNIDFERI